MVYLQPETQSLLFATVQLKHPDYYSIKLIVTMPKYGRENHSYPPSVHNRYPAIYAVCQDMNKRCIFQVVKYISLTIC